MHRDFINEFISQISGTLLSHNSSTRWMEIGRQEQDFIKKKFSDRNILTFDMVDKYKPDLVGDLTLKNSNIPSGSFGGIFCMEVLEHAVDPFACVEELSRMLEDGGFLVISTPLNCRIHGPVPDCWRFTEFGWKVLLKDFDIIEIDRLQTPDRNLFPIKYNILAKCNKFSNVDIHTMKFEPLTN